MESVHNKVAELIAKFQSASTFDEVATCWLMNRADMAGFTTVFSFDDIGTQFPIQAALGSYDGEKFFLRSLFSKPYIYFLNDPVWMSMHGRGSLEIPTESALLLDTQFGNYALSYIGGGRFIDSDVGQSFKELVTYLYRNDIAFNFSFYVIENFANYLAGDEDEIRAQVAALVKFGDADRSEFLSSGKIVLPYGEDTLKARVDKIMASYRIPAERAEMAKLELLQTRIAALLLKTVLLKSEPTQASTKVEKLLGFMHRDLSCMLEREFMICAKWLTGERVSLFDPVNSGPGFATAPQKVHGMAWDLMLIRHVEKYASQTLFGKFTVPYYSSFDRRLIETTDLHKSKGCLYPPPKLLGRYFMINDEDALQWIISVIGAEKAGEVLNDQQWKARDDNRPEAEDAFTLRRALEYRVVKALKPKDK